MSVGKSNPKHGMEIELNIYTKNGYQKKDGFVFSVPQNAFRQKRQSLNVISRQKSQKFDFNVR